MARTTPTTTAGARIIADLEGQAAAWDDAAASSSDAHLHRIRAEARRDTLRDLLRWLPAAVAVAELEACERQHTPSDRIDTLLEAVL